MISRSRSAAAFTVLAMLVLLGQALLLMRGPDFVAASLVNDDFFYYAQTAWNLRHTGVCSFDGIMPTNGVQMLWFWIVYALAWFAGSKDALMEMVVAACMVLNVLCLVPVWRIGRQAGWPVFPWMLAGLWILMLSSGVYWLGLENSLHAFFVWWLFAEVSAFFASDGEGRARRYLQLALLLAAGVWIRIDTAVLAAVMFSICVLFGFVSGGARFRGWWAGQGKAVLKAGLAAAPLGAAIPIIYYIMAGSWLPVSAIAKTSLYLDANTDPIHRLRNLVALSFPGLLPDVFNHHYPVVYAGFAVLILQLVIVVRSGLARRGAPARPLLLAMATMVAALLAYHAVIFFSRIDYPDYFNWYRSPVYIFWILVLAVTISAAREMLRARIADGLVVLLMIALLGLAGHRWQGRLVSSIEGRGNFVRREVGRWIDSNLPPDARLASWNSGFTGYFSNRHMVNLDGLINHVSYVRDVLMGPETMGHYLERMNVGFIVDYPAGIRIRKELDVATLSVVKQFPIRDHDPVIIWRLDRLTPDTPLQKQAREP